MNILSVITEHGPIVGFCERGCECVGSMEPNNFFRTAIELSNRVTSIAALCLGYSCPVPGSYNSDKSFASFPLVPAGSGGTMLQA
jgi:hypothetical protein